MTKTENPFGVVIAYTDEPVYSGFVSEKNADELAGTNKLFLNALFFSRVFDAP